MEPDVFDDEMLVKAAEEHPPISGQNAVQPVAPPAASDRKLLLVTALVSMPVFFMVSLPNDSALIVQSATMALSLLQTTVRGHLLSMLFQSNGSPVYCRASW